MGIHGQGNGSTLHTEERPHRPLGEIVKETLPRAGDLAEELSGYSITQIAAASLFISQETADKLDALHLDLRPIAPALKSIALDQTLTRKGAEEAFFEAKAAKESSDALAKVSVPALLTSALADVASVRDLVGKPGDPKAFARLSSHDMSPEQAAQLADASAFGTGLHFRMAKLEVTITALVRAAKIGAPLIVASALLGPNLPGLLDALGRASTPVAIGFAVVLALIAIWVVMSSRSRVPTTPPPSDTLGG